MSSGGPQKHFEVGYDLLICCLSPKHLSRSVRVGPAQGPSHCRPGPRPEYIRIIRVAHSRTWLHRVIRVAHSGSVRDGTGLPRLGPRPGRAVPRPGAMASETRYLVKRAAARGSVGSSDSARCNPHPARRRDSTARADPADRPEHHRRRMGWNEKIGVDGCASYQRDVYLIGVLLVLHSSDLLCRCVSVAVIGPACRSSESRIFVVAGPPRPSRVRFWLGSGRPGDLPGRLAKFPPPIRGHDPCFPTSGLRRRS